MTNEEAVEVLRKEQETLMSYLKDEDFCCIHQDRVNKMLPSLGLAISALQRPQLEEINRKELFDFILNKINLYFSEDGSKAGILFTEETYNLPKLVDSICKRFGTKKVDEERK